MLFSIVNHETSSSVLMKLFGNPDDYLASMLSTSASQVLPIRLGYVSTNSGDQMHALAVDSWTSLVYFVNTQLARVEYGAFVFNNQTVTGEWFNAQPPTKQVSDM
jgi:hypothetical protein